LGDQGEGKQGTEKSSVERAPGGVRKEFAKPYLRGLELAPMLIDCGAPMTNATGRPLDGHFTMDSDPQTPVETVAAIDLGSNSFHMIVARQVAGELHVVDRMRERVALAEGLDSHMEISEPVMARGIECLRRFGQRLWELPRERVRVVGTHTLRVARNSAAFLERAEAVLGHPIEIISGREEARLTHLGVAHGLPVVSGKRLVVDIGGGSTECMLGDGLDAVHVDSLPMGSVVWTRRHFPDGRITAKAMRKAIVTAAHELQSIEHHYHSFGWEACIGSSGTMVATQTLLNTLGWSETGITEPGVKMLRRYLLRVGEVGKIELPGLAPDRAQIMPGGVAIIQALFDRLRIARITASKSALREGVLYDLLGRIHHEDERDRTVSLFLQRYRVDRAQAKRVEETALAMLAQVGKSWELGDLAEAEQVLRWAARLHEIGLSISYDSYHKHSAYLVQHSNMPGFSQADQDMLAFLIGNHRRKLRLDSIQGLRGRRVPQALKLCVILRLAVCLNRGRRSHAKGFPIRMQASHEQVEVSFPGEWLEKHPLTSVDLKEERDLLGKAGIDLRVGDSSLEVSVPSTRKKKRTGGSKRAG